MQASSLYGASNLVWWICDTELGEEKVPQPFLSSQLLNSKYKWWICAVNLLSMPYDRCCAVPDSTFEFDFCLRFSLLKIADIEPQEAAQSKIHSLFYSDDRDTSWLQIAF